MLLFHIFAASLMGILAVWQLERNHAPLVIINIAMMCVNIVAAMSYI